MSQEKIELFSGSRGLNTVLDPQRLSQGTKNAPGIIEFAQAVNVSIDERGLCTTRNGYLLCIAGSFHSLFCAGGDCFAVQELGATASIVKINTNLSTTTIRSGISSGLRMCFAQINTDTFYSNGVQNGYISGGINYPWPVGIYNGPTADIDFVSAPVARHIAFLPGGKCVLSVGQYMFINHEPFQYGLFAPSLGFIGFESDISMICPTTDGFYVSDARQTWFFRKIEGGWYQYKQELVDSVPVLEWSLASEHILLTDAGLDLQGFGRVWASTEGICIGTDNGIVINRTKEQVKYPSGHTIGACLIKNDVVIHTIF